MNHFKFIFCLGLLTFIAACGGSSQVLDRLDDSTSLADLPNRYIVGKVSSSVENVPVDFLTSISENVAAELKQRNIYEDNETAPANILNINIISYRMRNDINRFMLGILAGKDGVKSIVRVVEKDSKKQIGKMYVDSFNLTNLGDEDTISSNLARKIVITLTGENDKKDINTNTSETPGQ